MELIEFPAAVVNESVLLYQWESDDLSYLLCVTNSSLAGLAL